MSPIAIQPTAAPADLASKPLYHSTLGNGTYALKVRRLFAFVTVIKLY